MESFYTLVQQRRSTRKFKSDVVPEEIKQNLLDIALMSPASKRSNRWEFIAIEDKETLEKLSKAKPHGGNFVAQAPLAIVVLANPEKSDVWVEDTSIASIYLQLAAEDLGLGSCWVQIRKRFHESGVLSSEIIKEILDIPQEYEVESIIAIGYKEEKKKPFDISRALTDKIHKESFSKK